jgi:hypothetical protein
MIKNINIVFGKPVNRKKRKKNEKAQKDSPFKKQSIFFRYLPYWKEFEIGHVIGTMHVTKGVFESTINLLLDIIGKMKDGLNAHKDLQVLGIKKDLHLQERPNGKVYLPLANNTLTNEETRAICKCLRGIRVPTEFSTNIKNLVSMSERKVNGYNTHDCHAMLSLFLTIAIRADLPFPHYRRPSSPPPARHSLLRPALHRTAASCSQASHKMPSPPSHPSKLASDLEEQLQGCCSAGRCLCSPKSNT